MADEKDDDIMGAADSSRVTTFQLYKRIEQLDRENEARYAELRADVRSVQQTLDGILHVQADHEMRVRSVERWKLSVPVSMLLAIAAFAGAVVSGK